MFRTCFLEPFVLDTVLWKAVQFIISMCIVHNSTADLFRENQAKV